MNWLFIGGGNMGRSLIGGLLASGVAPQRIAVADPDEDSGRALHERYQVAVKTTVAQAGAQLLSESSSGPLGLVVAVKPHVVKDVCKTITGFLADTKLSTPGVSSALIISVAAGIQSADISQWLNGSLPVIRCMPNTPSLLGLGATGLYANEHCNSVHREQASNLLAAVGTTVWVNEESQLDAVTAVSGSGPAYFFYLIEQMIKVGTELGLEPEVAQKLAIETAYGAASMARDTDQAPGTLRENVTSKGGTTAAALNVFNERELPDIVRQAMQAACDRAAEMGRNST